jgi:hypothetical protein
MKAVLFTSNHSVGRPIESITLFLGYLNCLDLFVMIACFFPFFFQYFDDDANAISALTIPTS